jgi:hypothetical protein
MRHFSDLTRISFTDIVESKSLAQENGFMAITKADLSAFHRFAEDRLANRGAESLQELVDLWELEHPTAELHAQNVAAVQAAIREMENGELGRSATKVVEELRTELAARRGQ